MALHIKILKLAVMQVALLLLGFVISEPVSGGYEDLVKNKQSKYGPPYGGGGGGDYHHEPANYDFQYEVFGGGNYFGHQESRKDQTATGSYHVLLPDGRRQIVTYVADESGYHPVVSYEHIDNPFDGPSGGYGGPTEKEGSKISGGYESPSGGGGGGYGAPIPYPEKSGGYSSRRKRQYHFATVPAALPVTDDQSDDDFAKIYKSEMNPEQKFRNRRRRGSSKRTYLIVYPNMSNSS